MSRKPFTDPYCRFCGERLAVPLDDLKRPWNRYPLFCSVAHAAKYGIACALEREPKGRANGPPKSK